jgi:hypothetical protein
MGFYYNERPPGRDDKPEQPGCLDALIITRVVLQLLFWPIAGLFLVIIDVGVAFVLFTIHPALALIPLAITIVAVWLIARWEQNRDRPPDYGEHGP